VLLRALATGLRKPVAGRDVSRSSWVDTISVPRPWWVGHDFRFGAVPNGDVKPNHD